MKKLWNWIKKTYDWHDVHDLILIPILLVFVFFIIAVVLNLTSPWWTIGLIVVLSLNMSRHFRKYHWNDFKK
jgi:hypothetical protein